MESGLKFIFYRKTRWFILFKFSFKFWAGNYFLCITKKIYHIKDLSTANNLRSKTNCSGNSFMFIKKIKRPRIEPWATSASTIVYIECWSLRISWFKVILVSGIYVAFNEIFRQTIKYQTLKNIVTNGK